MSKCKPESRSRQQDQLDLLKTPTIGYNIIYNRNLEIQLSDCFYILHTLMQSSPPLRISEYMHNLKALILVTLNLIDLRL